MMSQTLHELARDARMIHEALLMRAAGSPHTKGSCMYACILLQSMIEQFGNCASQIKGGNGQGDGGFIDRTGAMHGHYWVEAQTHDGLIVIDITADQFGEEPVVLAKAQQALQYVPGSQTVIDDHVSLMLEEIGAPSTHP